MIFGMSLLGIACIVISNMIMLPQLYRILKNKSARDVSLGMIGIGIVAQIVWAGYGYQIGDVPLWVSSAIACVIAVFVLIAYWYHEMRGKPAQTLTTMLSKW